VDGFKIGSISYDENEIIQDGMIAYGTWVTHTAPEASPHGYRISSAADSSLRFSFDGVKLTWTTTRGPAYGQAAIYVDGLLAQTVDLYQPRQEWQYDVVVSGLKYGNHTVLIKVLGTKNPASSGTGIVAGLFDIE
jgi:hypothetical protein